MNGNKILSDTALLINNLNANHVLESFISEITVKRWFRAHSVFTKCLSSERQEWPYQLNLEENNYLCCLLQSPCYLINEMPLVYNTILKALEPDLKRNKCMRSK